MALFSRRKKDSTSPGTPSVEDAPVDSSSHPEPAQAEAVPDVKISVSTYRGAGAAPRAVAQPASAPAAPAGEQTPEGGRRLTGQGEPPAPVESIPGMSDNVLVSQALAKVSEKATPAELIEVARQLLQGHLFLRVKGDARALLSEGKGLPLAVGRFGDDQYILAFSSGTALQAALKVDGETGTSALAQPAMHVLQHVLNGPYAGLLVDGASGTARAMIPRAVIEQAVSQADAELRLKSLVVSSPRTPEIVAQVGQALAEVPLWVAVNTTTAADGTEKVGVAEARTANGDRLINVFSHPLEVVALGRNDRALPFTGAQLGRALRENSAISGVIVDPAGPWLVLTRDALAPVLALPDPVPTATESSPSAAEDA